MYFLYRIFLSFFVGFPFLSTKHTTKYCSTSKSLLRFIKWPSYENSILQPSPVELLCGYTRERQEWAMTQQATFWTNTTLWLLPKRKEYFTEYIIFISTTLQKESPLILWTFYLGLGNTSSRISDAIIVIVVSKRLKDILASDVLIFQFQDPNKISICILHS